MRIKRVGIKFDCELVGDVREENETEREIAERRRFPIGRRWGGLLTRHPWRRSRS